MITYLAEVPYGGSNGNKIFPFPTKYLKKEYTYFSERTLCFLVMNTNNNIIQKLIEFYIGIYIRQLKDLILGRYVNYFIYFYYYINI